MLDGDAYYDGGAMSTHISESVLEDGLLFFDDMEYSHRRLYDPHREKKKNGDTVSLAVNKPIQLHSRHRTS